MTLPPSSFFLLFSLTLIISKNIGVLSEQPHIFLPLNHHQNKEKLTHIHFYYHDIRNNKESTIVQISNTNLANGFGSTYVMDDPMTEGQELSSKEIGRAQGMFGLASLEDVGFFMLTTFVFNEGSEYVGSTLIMVGRNPLSKQNREMAIVGGTGVFRFARGYVVANSVYSISTEAHFVMEYDIMVYHQSLN